eukprot:1158091-Pelagomonas_calceolata.AAC.5
MISGATSSHCLLPEISKRLLGMQKEGAVVHAYGFGAGPLLSMWHPMCFLHVDMRFCTCHTWPGQKRPPEKRACPRAWPPSPTICPTMPPSPSGPLWNWTSEAKAMSSTTRPHCRQHEKPWDSSTSTSTSAAHVPHHILCYPSFQIHSMLIIFHPA